jgi:hypothetical protein
MSHCICALGRSWKSANCEYPYRNDDQAEKFMYKALCLLMGCLGVEPTTNGLKVRALTGKPLFLLYFSCGTPVAPCINAHDSA